MDLMMLLQHLFGGNPSLGSTGAPMHPLLQILMQHSGMTPGGGPAGPGMHLPWGATPGRPQMKLPWGGGTLGQHMQGVAGMGQGPAGNPFGIYGDHAASFGGGGSFPVGPRTK